MTDYVCKYAPAELMAGFGMNAAPCDPAPEETGGADRLIHRNVCSFSRALIGARAEQGKGPLLLTDCCDSIRRVCDVLRALGQKVYMAALPRRQDECARLLYRDELLRLMGELEGETGKQFDSAAFRGAFSPAEEPEEGPYVAVMGARAGGRLLEEIRAASPYPVRNNTCTGLRRLGLPPETDDREALMGWYAGALLAQPACMRMSDVSSRRALTEDPNLKGIIYHTVKFCDFYGFEYAALRETASIPLLKLETDYTPQGAGQLDTRLGAFFEELGVKRAPGIRSKKAAARFWAGVDSGSTSTNAVVLGGDGKITGFWSVPTGVKVAESARKALDGALAKAGLTEADLRATVTTGYGRTGIAFRDGEVTEITCHARGAHYLNPAVRTVIDIGGQDSKVIRLDEDGNVRDFVMNDKCAAGTGRFLEMMAQSLGLTLEEISVLGLSWKEEVTISSMCSVFAQSEVVSLIAEDKRLEDIVHGIDRSVAARVAALAGRGGMEPEYMMTGGVAKNRGVVKALEDKLRRKLCLPEEPDVCGALGAALIAREGDEAAEHRAG